MKDLSDYTANELTLDEYGRPNGIVIADKPEGKTSHDIVDEYRRKLNTRKVGHAGALDPFATGVLIILVGKALKLSDKFLNLNKEYEAEVLIGISTDSFDIEGRVLKYIKGGLDLTDKNLSNENIIKELTSFKGEYDQYVPVFSSVKVNGDKLRELARSSERFELIEEEGKRVVVFYKNINNKEVEYKRVELPLKKVNIYSIEDTTKSYITLSELSSRDNFKNVISQINPVDTSSINLDNIKYISLKFKVSCSKGTYIRQLAYDIGSKLGYPSMLINLRRTRVGEFGI